MNNSDIWTEKYRPKVIDDLCISPETRSIITNFGKNLPNLLLCASPGRGKTTLARILVQQVLDCDYLYINASEENGIDTIRNKVMGFAQTKSMDGGLKVVILDEGDFLSTSSQAACRNLMESYSDTTRFILTGNYRHKIIPALQSRCQTLDLDPTVRDTVIRCFDILKWEGVELDLAQKKQVVLLVKRNFPDLRKCINELQKSCYSGTFVNTNAIDNTNCLNIVWNNLMSKNSLATRKYLIENEPVFNSDWDQLLSDLLNYIYEQNIDDSKKKAMIIIIADHLDKSTRVLDKEINLFACLLNLEEYC